MGAWGSGIFENDTASDWALSLEEARDASLIDETLKTVLSVGGDYLDASVAEEGLAAAEAVARLKGRWGTRDAYTEPMDKWVERYNRPPSVELLRNALSVVDRVLSAPSELLELWEESDDAGAWRASIDDLRARLA